MGAQRPAAVTRATWLVAGVVAMSGLTAVFTAVFKGELVAVWAEGRTDVGSVQPPAFVPVAITLFVVVAVLAAVLLVFFRAGFTWARVVLSALSVLMAVTTFAALRSDPPALFLVLSAVSVLVDLTAAIALWHRDVRAFTAAPVEYDAHV